jgi:Mrp family chromosome partitioning ATPase
MSLIEKALARLQENRGRGPEPTPLAVSAPVAAFNEPAPPAAPPPPAMIQPQGELVLPHSRLRDLGMLPPEDHVRLIAEQYRKVKRPLISRTVELNAVPGSCARALMVTSALPGDGKTFTSLNLALSLALERDFTVLLVDGDVAKRDLTTALGVSAHPGLLDLIADEQLGIDACTLRTDQPGLLFMPAGASRSTAPELLGSARTRTLIEQTLQQYPTVLMLFDSPPVLLTSEAPALRTAVGQVIMVVHAGVSLKQSVNDALHVLGTSRPVSLLLNQAAPRIGQGYGYGYGYGYGTRGPDGSDKPQGSS